MNRAELKHFILENYNTESDFPWMKHPNYEVFRHSNNQKWFALIMDIPKNKLGLQGSDLLDVVNLKCDTLLIGSLRCEPGFFPAYHMNKDSWITIALDGSVSDDKIKMLLDASYDATAPKAKHQKR
ncbi:MmcQ/YjbR family DNA-binding protein [Allofournierella massiliensis]|uniref:MmcQ/YjbR family DNA-binding protein n=1 Tax=Allofournierella massiliensis TaxID=1650663 RepID=A0ABT7UQV8_9FIRM|nr:MmcQ/YjbR family DNA-binding protein [Fournierella massiliensis]MDM8201272.1 MmcQ/YjbR family DNA-binding protein [Fournierella massiliensis]